MKTIIKTTACIQDVLNDFKKKANLKDNNEALFLAVMVAEKFMDDKGLKDIAKDYHEAILKDNIKITRR